MNTRSRRARRLSTSTTFSIALCLQALGCASTPSAKDPSIAMSSQTTSSTDVVKQFFDAFGKGNVDGVIATFHPQAEIVAVRKASRKEGEVYGTYSGTDGARAFIASLGNAFDTKAFSVDSIVGDGKVAFASGSFTHELKSTHKPFTSDWALKCVVEDGKIREYHFFEDSAAFVEASR